MRFIYFVLLVWMTGAIEALHTKPVSVDKNMESIMSYITAITFHGSQHITLSVMGNFVLVSPIREVGSNSIPIGTGTVRHNLKVHCEKLGPDCRQGCTFNCFDSNLPKHYLITDMTLVLARPNPRIVDFFAVSVAAKNEPSLYALNATLHVFMELHPLCQTEPCGPKIEDQCRIETTWLNRLTQSHVICECGWTRFGDRCEFNRIVVAVNMAVVSYILFFCVFGCIWCCKK